MVIIIRIVATAVCLMIVIAITGAVTDRISEKKVPKEAKTVTCQDCGHVIDRNYAHRVKHYWNYGDKDSFYCKEHKKPYDEYYYDASSLSTRHSLYYKKFEVDQSTGTPVGYVRDDEL